jgi:hypothetical protein
MSICRLCGLEKQLIKAHIIPRKLYEPIREASIGKPPSDKVPRMYVVGTEQKSKQFQSGIYDASILCRECDGDLIGVWDNYGQKFLLSPSFSENHLFDNLGKSAAYRIKEFDYKQLKLFFMSILWRAAITSDLFFAQIKLGSWEEKLRKMILAQDPGNESDFSVVLFKYEGDLSAGLFHSKLVTDILGCALLFLPDPLCANLRLLKYLRTYQTNGERPESVIIKHCA